MTRQEAIAMIEDDKKRHHDELSGRYRQALTMAIEALQQEEIIKCKNCKYWHEWEHGAGSCHRSDIMWVGSDYYDYCSFAERKEQ